MTSLSFAYKPRNFGQINVDTKVLPMPISIKSLCPPVNAKLEKGLSLPINLLLIQAHHHHPPSWSFKLPVAGRYQRAHEGTVTFLLLLLRLFAVTISCRASVHPPSLSAAATTKAEERSLNHHSCGFVSSILHLISKM